MESDYLELDGYPCGLDVEADTDDRSVEFTIAEGAYKSVELPVTELKKLRDFLSEFLNEVDEIERLKEERAGL